jgi:hypothetical protein
MELSKETYIKIDDIQGIKTHLSSIKLNLPSEIDLTISSGGYAGFYATLLCFYINQYSNTKIIRISGASAGALLGALIIANPSLEVSLNSYKILQDDYKTNKISMVNGIEKMLNAILPENIAELCSGRLFITVNEVTLTGLKKHVVSEFKDKEDVIHTTLASSTVPLYTTDKLYKYWHNKTYVDGLTPIQFTDKLRPELYINLHDCGYSPTFCCTPIDNDIIKIMFKGLDDFIALCNGKSNLPVEWNRDSTRLISKKSLLSKLIMLIKFLFLFYRIIFIRYWNKLLNLFKKRG